MAELISKQAQTWVAASPTRVIKLAFLAAGFASLCLSVALWFSGIESQTDLLQAR